MRRDLEPAPKTPPGASRQTAYRYGITERQLFVLMLIDLHFTLVGYAPSMRELANGMKATSNNAAKSHVASLKAKGLISRDQRVARSIVITAAGKMLLEAAQAAPEPSSAKGPTPSPLSPVTPE